MPALILNKRWKVLLLICYLFIISGGVNAGVTAFYLAIPFMLGAVWINFARLKNKKLNYFTSILIFCSIIFSVTLHKNPLIFPIINDGYIEVLSDGYYVSYEDGSGGFVDSPIDQTSFNVSYKALKKGDRYKVIGIESRLSGFTSVLLLQTEIGPFSERDYQGNLSDEAKVQPSKRVTAEWANMLSILMYWPAGFMMLFNAASFN